MSISDNSIEYHLIEQYCNNISFKKGLSKNTIFAYKSDLKIFLIWLGDNKEKFSNVLFVSKNDAGCRICNYFSLYIQNKGSNFLGEQYKFVIWTSFTRCINS